MLWYASRAYACRSCRTLGVMMEVSRHQAEDFAQYARIPETWAIAARRQLAVAQHLFERQRSAASGISWEERSGCHYAAYLHYGFAVENAAKAALVSADPSVVRDDGTLDRSKLGPKGGHDLSSLCTAVLVNLDRPELELLAKLQEYVIWAGRYTIPMNGAVLFDEERMNRLRLSAAGEAERIERLVISLLSCIAAK